MKDPPEELLKEVYKEALLACRMSDSEPLMPQDDTNQAKQKWRDLKAEMNEDGPWLLPRMTRGIKDINTFGQGGPTFQMRALRPPPNW